MNTPGNSPIRVALMGYGLAGSTFHAPFITTTPALALRAVVTGDPERRARAAHDHPGAPPGDNAGGLWAHPRDFDLVVVATPNRTHAPLARAALEAGLAVVVDKPFAPTAAEAEALIHDARR